MSEPKYRKITIDIEDGNTVTHIEKDNGDFLKQYNQLQSNWNSLREWVQKHYDEYKDMEQDAMFEFGLVLDKMNKLEGKDKE